MSSWCILYSFKWTMVLKLKFSEEWEDRLVGIDLIHTIRYSRKLRKHASSLFDVSDTSIKKEVEDSNYLNLIVTIPIVSAIIMRLIMLHACNVCFMLKVTVDCTCLRVSYLTCRMERDYH